MKNPFKPGDTKTYEKLVTEADFACFDTGLVHPVCSTFSLAQAAEWASRLFVLEMKEEGEEGIGTMVLINHLGPALLNETIKITATVKQIDKNELICSYEGKIGDRLIVTGETGQKIIKKEKLEKLFGLTK